MTGHYLGKTIGVDQNYGGVMPVEVGRVKRKLETYGEVRHLVLGAFAEVSEGVHELVHIVAQSRLKAMGLQRVSVCDKGELCRVLFIACICKFHVNYSSSTLFI